MDGARELIGLAGFRHLPFELWWMYRRRFELITDWNREHQAFFIHIPKTAGTSIYRSLGMTPLPYTHVPARILKRLHPDEFKRAYTFAFVRNPWDRMVSTFSFLKKGVTWPEQKGWAESHLGDQSFNAFLKRMAGDFRYRNRIMSYNFFFDQYYFLSDRRGRLIVSEILKFEALGENFARVQHQLGLDAPLAHDRKSSRNADFASNYDQAGWDFVGDIYKRDIKAFGY